MEKAQKLFSTTVILLLGLIAFFGLRVAEPFDNGFGIGAIWVIVVGGILSMWITDA